MSQLRRVKVKMRRDQFEETAARIGWDLLGEGPFMGIVCGQRVKVPRAYGLLGWTDGEVLYDNMDLDYYQQFIGAFFRDQLQNLGFHIQEEQHGIQRILIARRGWA